MLNKRLRQKKRERNIKKRKLKNKRLRIFKINMDKLDKHLEMKEQAEEELKVDKKWLERKRQNLQQENSKQK